MERTDVYKVIDGERDHQDSFSKAKGYQPTHSIEGHLVMLKSYLDKAFEDWTHHNKGETPVLHTIRKITAMGVRCMEEHGAPPRQ